MIIFCISFKLFFFKKIKHHMITIIDHIVQRRNEQKLVENTILLIVNNGSTSFFVLVSLVELESYERPCSPIKVVYDSIFAINSILTIRMPCDLDHSIRNN